MYIEEVYTKLSIDHIKRCYRALVLADKMMELYRKRTEEFKEEFCTIIEEYMKGDDEE